MNVPEREKKILDFWEKNKVYEKVKEARKEGRRFFFLDGPPYATGRIHLGTAMNKVIKDCFLRFYRMKGFNVWDQPGYDTHGVPIEIKVEREFGFKNKKDIEKFGVENFVKKCREFATKNIDMMKEEFKNIGVWMEWERPYLTLSDEYIEGAWFTFKKAYEKKYLFKGKYPVHVCPRCETVVAYNEIEYEKLKDPSIFVKFKLKDREKEYLLIWTTTPWTIPANTGVMVKPDAEYSKVKVNDEILYVASELVENVMKECGIENYEIVGKIKGREMEGMRYEHPLSDIFTFQKELKDAHRVVLSDQFVTLEEGTGLVHTAPGHGAEDYKVGVETGLPQISPVKIDGTFDENCGKYSGVFVKEADKDIIEDLRKRGLLLHEGEITHDYPTCWRCESPLIMISVPQWFFRVTSFREKLLEENEKISWNPEWGKSRFRDWLKNLGDWPVSRQRYWGIPLPIWECEKCGNVKVVGSVDELPSKPKELHRPYVDEITLECEKCGGTMRRIKDVLDVWFDSGVAPWASLGYPRKKEDLEKMWPVDFVMEGTDQFRGWWNSMMITGFITFGECPFKSVLVHGLVLDAHGKKMSKSLQNIVTVEEVVEKYGRDVLRFYYLSNIPWEDYYFSFDELDEIRRKLLIVRNCFEFVSTYAKEEVEKSELEIEDRWILSKVNSLVNDVTKEMERHNPHKASNLILDFVIRDFSRWYIKLIRDRVWPFYEGRDKEAAIYTLRKVADTILRIFTPFCPFLTEEYYQRIFGKKISVNMEDWPEVEKEFVDENLEKNMETVRKVFEAVSFARQKANIKLRWPISKVYISSDDEKVLESVERMKKVLERICNAKEVFLSKEVPEGYVQSDFENGKVFVPNGLEDSMKEEAFVKELVRSVQNERKKRGFKVEEKIVLYISSDEKKSEWIEKYSEFIKREVGAVDIVIGQTKGEYEGKLLFEGETAFSFTKLPPEK
ncbi:MAG: isoleucine--tRNA ligase [Candidatus Syntropharchaeia archaeon]